MMLPQWHNALAKVTGEMSLSYGKPIPPERKIEWCRQILLVAVAIRESLQEQQPSHLDS